MRWKVHKLKVIALFIAIIIFVWCVWKYRAQQINGSFSKPTHFHKLIDSTDLRHKIWYNVWKPSIEGISTEDVTVVTQTSLNNLHHLETLSKTWNGYISVAIFTTGNELQTSLNAITQLLSCNPNLANRVFLHLVIPVSHPPYPLYMEILKSVCTKDKLNTKQDVKNYDLRQISYPVNLLRNVALKQVPTEYVFVIDVDMLPSKNLRNAVLDIPLLKQSRVALVVPAFEVKTDHEIPDNKEVLLDYWLEGKLRPFYEKVCWKCQMYTQYDEWQKQAKRAEQKETESEYQKISNELTLRTLGKDDSISYSVSWHDPWEPFYIAKRHEISYDERFEQYGFNRISQLCYLHMSGHTFHVLRQSFLLHIGFKENQDFHSNKNEENERNKIIYRQVKEEMKKKYPESGRKC